MQFLSQKFMLLLITVFLAMFATSSAALDNYNLALATSAGGQNTAGPTAIQSSTGTWGSITGHASRAIDGNTSGVWGSGSVSHTLYNGHAWWQIDLGEIKFIDTILLWNRTDCCANRGANFHVFVSDVPFTGAPTIANAQAQAGVTDYYITGQMGRPTTITVGRTGRYVRMQLVNPNYLQLGEVQIIGDDPVTADPKLDVVKSADVSSGAVVGQTITYTYEVTNTGNTVFTNLTLVDDHLGFGTPPVPLGETLTTDSSPTGDSSDTTANDGVWTTIGPGDVVTFTGTYVVVQQDIDELQN